MNPSVLAMNTNIRDSAHAVVTPEEAAAISELWAKRREEAETLGQRYSVAEIAEVMSIPPAEVEVMLRLIRSNPNTESGSKLEKKRRKRRRWLITGAVAFWLATLAIAFSAVYNWGQSRSYAPYYPQRQFLYDGSGSLLRNAQGVVSTGRTLDRYLPTGFSAEFQGYAVDGEGDISHLTEANLEYGLTSLIAKMTSDQPGYGGGYYTSPELAEALRSGKLGEFEGRIKFEEIVVKTKGRQLKASIPVDLSNNHEYMTTVDAEVTRRLRILANQVWRLAKGKEVGS